MTAALPSNNIRATIWATLGCLLIASMWALAKGLGERFDSQQIVFFRALSGLLLIAPFVCLRGLVIVRTRRLGLHVTRGIAGAIATTCGFYAVIHLPLSDATALSFTQPLFLVLLAGLILREKTDLRRWALVACGALGVIIMVRPGLVEIDMVALVALAGALAAACVKLFVKQLAVTEAPLTILFYMALTTTFLTAGPAWLSWRAPAPMEQVALMSTGVLATLAQLCTIQAYRIGEASAIAPAEYSRLLFAAFFGVLLFDEILDPMFLLGAAIIVMSTLCVDQEALPSTDANPTFDDVRRRQRKTGRLAVACLAVILCGVFGFSVDLSEQADASDRQRMADSAKIMDEERTGVDKSPPRSSDAYSIATPKVDPATNLPAPRRSEIDESLTAAAHAPALVEIYPAIQSIDEREQAVAFKVSLSKPAERLVFLAYTTVDGSAKAGEDYQLLRGVLAFQPGEATTMLLAPLLDDDLVEGEEQFELWLTAAPDVVQLLTRKAVVTIADNDDSRIGFGSKRFGGLDSQY